MKLFNQFTILKKNLRDLDYAKKNKVNYWTRECEEHPTNPHCLVYCDQQVILLFYRRNKLGINGQGIVLFERIEPSSFKVNSALLHMSKKTFFINEDLFQDIQLVT